MKKISWTDRVRNELCRRVKEDWNILKITKSRNINWIGRTLRINCLTKHAIERMIEGKIEVTEIRGRRRKQLLDDLKEKRVYWKLKGGTRSYALEEAMDRRLTECRIVEYALHRHFACFDTSHSKLVVRSDIIETDITLREPNFQEV
jgi:hypothetical protein